MDYFLIFIFGTIVGSFLNVVICRYNTGQSIIKGNSHCLSCNEKLKWHELIPIISFIIQKGKCRNCGGKISIQYPLVEFITGIMFVLIFQITHYSLLITGYYFIIFSLLIIIAVYDIHHQIIPNFFVYLFSALAILNVFLFLDFKNLFWQNFLAGTAFFGFFGFFWLVSKGKWMGLGDAKLALGGGWLLGFSEGILALLLSFWIGAIFGLFLLLLGKGKYGLKSRIAFGPFLVVSIFIAFLFGGDIINIAVNYY